MRGENVSDELIGSVLVSRFGEHSPVEHLSKVTIALHHIIRFGLKVGLGELRFHQQRTELHIHLGAITVSVRKRNTCPKSKLRRFSRLHPKDGAGALHGPRMTEDIHQQSIGTHAGIKFSPTMISLGQVMCGSRMDLPESASPLRIAKNRPISNVQEVSVGPVSRLVHHHGILSIAADVAKSPRSRILQVASVEFLPELRSARDQAEHLNANSSGGESSMH